MSAVAKAHPPEIRLKPRTPRRVIREIRNRYSDYILDNDTVNYFETELHREVEAGMKPGDYVRHVRAGHRLTLAQLGRGLGVSAQRVHALENGKRGISKRIAGKLSTVFNISAEVFI